MLNQLQAFWTKNGIAAESFTCPHQDQCRRGDFVGPKEAYVGPQYEEGGPFPRLVFVSLDPGWSYAEPAKRTWQAVRSQVMGYNLEKFPKGRHWYRTVDLAYRILNRFVPQEVSSVYQATPYFAHINCVKCCMNKNEARSQADRVLFDNCKDYIPKELELLQPDIIVSQGNAAWTAVSKGFRKDAKVSHHQCHDGSSLEYYEIELVGKPALWFFTYHPTTSHYNRKHHPYLEDFGDIAQNRVRL